MQIGKEFDHVALLREIMASQPEASAGQSIQCYDWDYDDMWFDFRDVEADASTADPSVIPAVIQDLNLRFGPHVGAVTYRVTLPDLERGLQLMADQFAKGRLHGLTTWTGLSLANFDDPGVWDSLASDILVQYTIFGREIYA